MRVQVFYNKIIEHLVKNVESGDFIEVPDVCTFNDVLHFLGIPHERHAFIPPIVNNASVWKSTTLKDGDRIDLLPMMGGG